MSTPDESPAAAIAAFFNSRRILQIDWENGRAATVTDHSMEPDAPPAAPARVTVDPSAPRLGFEAGTFETTFALDTLPRVPEPELAAWIAEIFRVTRRHLLVVVPAAPRRDRAWWESRFIAAGFRRHPRLMDVVPYEQLEREDAHIHLVFEKMPAACLSQFPLEALKAERDLHMDMLRESGRRSDAHLARYVMARRYLPAEGLVLDAACGLGYGSAILGGANPALKVVGMDNSDFAVRYAESAISPVYPNVEFRRGDVCDLRGFPDGSASLVVSFETVEHLREPDLFLREIRRVLKPGGVFVCSVPNMWVDEDGRDPNPWHFHVFDFPRLATLCGRHLSVAHAYLQTAGGGMKLAGSPRALRRVDMPVTPLSGDAEWWLIAARKPDASVCPSAENGRVLVFTHAPEHPLFSSWLSDFPLPVSYVTDAEADFAFPDDTALVVTFDCYREPMVTLLRRAAEAGIPTLLLADGILEYRNTWEHPQLTPGSLYQPVVAHKLACIGRSQARVVESWGNAGRCEIVGSPRLDVYAGRSRRTRPADRPFRLLVMTAITPYFDEVQHAHVRRSLEDLKAHLATVPIEVCWRLTKGLDAEIGVDSLVTDLTGLELADVLQNVDAVVTTPSTSMIEAMLLGLPVALLDYCNRPHYVPAAWRITAPGHIAETIDGLRAPTTDRLLYQNHTLHDALECATPAAPRMRLLAEKMIEAGRAARAAGVPLSLPSRLIAAGQDEPAAVDEHVAPISLFPGHEPFARDDRRELQVENGHLRAYVAELRQASSQSLAPQPPASVGEDELQALRAKAALTLQWRVKLEAGIALAALHQRAAAVRLMVEGVKSVENCRHPGVIIEAIVETAAHLAPLDPRRARPLLEAVLPLARRFEQNAYADRAARLLSGIDAASLRPAAPARPEPANA